MIFLIWFITLFIDALITTLLVHSGTQLGALSTLILYVCSFFIAKKLCSYYKRQKNSTKNATSISVSSSLDKEINIDIPSKTLKHHYYINLKQFKTICKYFWGVIPSIALIITIVLLTQKSYSDVPSSSDISPNAYSALYNNYIYLSDEYRFISNSLNENIEEKSLSQLKADRQNVTHSDDIKVYVSNDSLKYHLTSDCTTSLCEHINLNQAISSGYEPCEKCYPLPSK